MVSESGVKNIQARTSTACLCNLVCQDTGATRVWVVFRDRGVWAQGLEFRVEGLGFWGSRFRD